MNMATKLLRTCAAALLACTLMLPMAAWADGDTLDATVSFGDGGAGLTIPAVSKTANTLLLRLSVEPGTNGEGQAYDIDSLSFDTALRNLKINDVTTEGNTIQVVLSAGTNDLFVGANGTIELGTLSMKSSQAGAEATVKVAEFETLSADYVSTADPGDTITAVYRVNEATDPTPDDENPGKDPSDKDPGGATGDGDGNGSNGNGSGDAPTTPAGYNPSSASGNANVSKTGDAMMYGVPALVVLAAASGALLLVRAKRSKVTEER